MKAVVVPSIALVAMLVPGLVSDARAGSLRFDDEPAAMMTEDRWIDGPGNGRFALPWGIAEVQQSAGLSGSGALAIAPGSAVAWERPSLAAPASGGSATTISTHRLVAFSNETDFRLGTNGTVIGTGDAALTAFSDGTSYFRIEPDGRVLEFASVTDWLDPVRALRDHGITFAGTKVRCAYARPGAYFLQLSGAAGSFVSNDIIRFPSVTDLVGGTNGTVIANGAGGTIDALHTGSTVYKIDANGVLQSGSGDSIYEITTIGAFHLGTNLAAAFGDGTSLYVQHPWQYTVDPPTDVARVRKLSSFHLRLSDPDAAPPVTPAESLRVVLHVGADGLSALDGNGTGGGTWRLVAPTQSDQFHRISILEDHLAGTYEVNLDAVRIASGLGFKDFNPASSVSFTRIESGSAAWIDHILPKRCGSMDPRRIPTAMARTTRPSGPPAPMPRIRPMRCDSGCSLKQRGLQQTSSRSGHPAPGGSIHSKPATSPGHWPRCRSRPSRVMADRCSRPCGRRSERTVGSCA